MTHLDPENIRILNWNLQKQTSERLHHELDTLQENSDVVALQEAVLEPHFLSSLNHHNEFSFTPGYRGLKFQTGVVTLTRRPVLASEQHRSVEPWLRTPKAIHITRHELEGYERDLLLINIHAVNFTLGDTAFRQQLAAMLPFLDQHLGPAVVTGDFNTWNNGRNKSLRDFIEHCHLQEVPFEEDHRKRILRHPLDHMFCRGLDVISASTCKTGSSDHNPLLARLKVHPG